MTASVTSVEAPSAACAPSDSFGSNLRSNGSFQNNLDALREGSTPSSSEFKLSTGAAKVDVLDNPLAQLLQIRTTIQSAPAWGPGFSAFPVLTQPVLARSLSTQQLDGSSLRKS